MKFSCSEHSSAFLSHSEQNSKFSYHDIKGPIHRAFDYSAYFAYSAYDLVLAYLHGFTLDHFLSFTLL